MVRCHSVQGLSVCVFVHRLLQILSLSLSLTFSLPLSLNDKATIFINILDLLMLIK